MQRIQIQRKPSRRPASYLEVLPLDARDPDILRAKRLLRERERPVTPRPHDAS